MIYLDFNYRIQLLYLDNLNQTYIQKHNRFYNYYQKSDQYLLMRKNLVNWSFIKLINCILWTSTRQKTIVVVDPNHFIFSILVWSDINDNASNKSELIKIKTKICNYFCIFFVCIVLSIGLSSIIHLKVSVHFAKFLRTVVQTWCIYGANAFLD